MIHDNYIENRGFGNWAIMTYKPEETFGPFTGWLQVSKDFHIILESYDKNYISSNNDTNCLASFPSQNIAAAINMKEATK